MREIFLDTETTGLDFKSGHRIIEIGAIEMINRRLTGNNLQLYFNPGIKVDDSAFKIHGLSNSFLKSQPPFKRKADEIMSYLNDAQIIVHNAAFDIPFLNWELHLLKNSKWENIEKYCNIIDSLKIAREKYPGQKNTLDALCSRYGIYNKNRVLHGALLDASILADVYLMMTGGQIDLFSLAKSSFSPSLHKNNDDLTNVKKCSPVISSEKRKYPNLLNLLVNNPRSDMHNKYLKLIDEKSQGSTVWRKLCKSNADRNVDTSLATRDNFA